MKPRLLDLCCAAGGCTRGYQLAGFHVTGIDIKPQPRYCGDAFHQGDALEFLAAHGHEFDAVSASPPCQGYSEATPVHLRGNTPKLIPAFQAALRVLGKPYVIENVEGAADDLDNPIMLCGTMFGLNVWRHRYFEVRPSFFALIPPCDHGKHPDLMTPPGSHSRRSRGVKASDFDPASVGLGWMKLEDWRLAIPPAYTQFLGAHLMQNLEVKAA